MIARASLPAYGGRDRGLIFSAPMVRALWDGRKTQTRRPIEGVPRFLAEHERRWNAHACPPGGARPLDWTWWEGPSHGPSLYHRARLPWRVGGRLWVREAIRRVEHHWCYAADDVAVPWPGRSDIAGLMRETISPMMMRRSCSRLTLTLDAVRVERLQDISETDVIAEGVDLLDSELSAYSALWERGECTYSHETRTRRPAFMRVWNSIHGPDAWVAALTITVERRNIDAPATEAAHA